MLCRYDTMALKSLDIFSLHGFPIGLVHAESNRLGITNDSGSTVGSGGRTNIIEKYAKANDRAAVRRNGCGRPAAEVLFHRGATFLPPLPPAPKARTDQCRVLPQAHQVLVTIRGVIWCNIRFAYRIEIVEPQAQAAAACRGKAADGFQGKR
jgi:hypothetical protein